MTLRLPREYGGHTSSPYGDIIPAWGDRLRARVRKVSQIMWLGGSGEIPICLPSIIGGIPYLILIILAIVPPFLLATLFWLDEQSNATLIQKAESPNGAKTVEVYFRPVGAYSGGNGRIEVHLKYTWLPFVKRDIYFVRVTHADENTHDYLSWVDNETLDIPEKNTKVKINWIEWEIPSIISLPIGVVDLFFRPP